MNSIPFRTWFLLLSALALFPMAGRADYVNFDYSWQVQPSAILPGGTGSVALAVAQNGSASSEVGGTMPTYIPGAMVTTTSAAVDLPDTFNTDFNMILTLSESGQSGSLTFRGHLEGSLTGTTSTLTSTFYTPVTQMLTLGKNIYTVTIGPTLANLPIPGSNAPVLIDAQVRVTEKPVDSLQTPEPSSLLLGASALIGLAARRMLRHRRRREQLQHG